MLLCCDAHCPVLVSLYKSTGKSPSSIVFLQPAPVNRLHSPPSGKKTEGHTHNLEYVLRVGKLLYLQALHHHCHQLHSSPACSVVLSPIGNSCIFSSVIYIHWFMSDYQSDSEFPPSFHIPCKHTYTMLTMGYINFPA